MKTSINFTNATKRHTLIMLISLFTITFCMYACNESNWSDSFANVTKDNSEISRDQLKIQFGYAFAKVLAENKDVRDIIKKEAIKKIDFDYDVLYTMIKDQTIQTGKTIEESMLDYISIDTLNTIIQKMPTLTIFVPELPEHIFSAETWETENIIPEIAIRLADSYNVPILDNNGNMEICEVDEIPMFPVVVIKENERITSITNIKTKASPNELLRQSDLTFADEIFNNISIKSPSTRTYNSITSSSQSNRGVVKVDSRFEKVVKAYNIISDTSQLPLTNNNFNPKIREGNRSQEVINSASYDYYPKMNNGYYTSWYRIYIAPSSFN